MLILFFTGNSRPLMLIMYASSVAYAGNGIALIVFPWLVLQLNGSATEASLVVGATILPMLISMIAAGTIVDYFGRKRISLIADFLTAASVASVPLISWIFGAEAINLGVLAGLAASASTFDSVGMTARKSMLPEAAARAGWSLDRTNSIYQAKLNLALIVGPGIGGVMISVIGDITTMWITVGLFGLSLLAIALLQLDGIGKPHRETRPTGLVSGAAEGLRFFWDLRILRTLGLIELCVAALYLPMESVLFPKYFNQRHASTELGWVLMALALGSLLGAIGYAAISAHLRRRVTVLTAVLSFGAGTALIAFLPPLPIILVLTAMIGLVYGPIQPIYNYVIQTRAPHHLRARVVGAMSSLPYAAGPLGLLIAGPLADAAGLQVTFLALAIPILVIGLVASRLPVLHELDREAEFPVNLAA
ncbi:MAG: MFS transporter [Mycobacteriaceae bacterium]|nr:MFS transporter [Mycobacteriaceae bacterium]